MTENLGTVTIAPQVLVTIVKMTTEGIPGVVRLMAGPTSATTKSLGKPTTGDGVRVWVVNDAVEVEVGVVVSRDANMRQVGTQIQTEVARAIEHMLGMPVRQVNVSIRDVSPPGGDDDSGGWG